MTQNFGDFPSTLATNNVVAIFLLLSFLLMFVSTAHLRRFLARQTYNFLYRPSSDKIFGLTKGEQHYQLFLLFMTCVFLALTAALLTGIVQTGDLLLLTAITVGVMAVKLVLHIFVGHTFFNKGEYRLWKPSLIYINAAEGILLMPVVLTQIYHGLPLKFFVAYVVLIVVAVRLATLVKSWNTLLGGRKNPALFLLYFWAAEVTPLLVLVAIVAAGVGYEP